MSKSLERDLDDNLSCPVCLENFIGEHIPKDLDCPHVCCQICLENMPSDIIGGLKCPQCQRVTTIPDGGVPALRTNILARNLAETLSNHKKAEPPHNVKHCAHHDNQEVLFFCKSCKHALCQYCIIQEHASHRYEPIQSLVKFQRQKIGRALQKAQVHINTCKEIDMKVAANEEVLNTKFQKAEERIEQRIEECMKEINTEGEHLKKKLGELKTKALGIVQTQKESNQSRWQKKKDVVEETQSCLEQASDSEYLILHDKLFSKLKMLIEDDTSTVESVSAESGFKLEVCRISFCFEKLFYVELENRSEVNFVRMIYQSLCGI